MRLNVDEVRMIRHMGDDLAQMLRKGASIAGLCQHFCAYARAANVGTIRPFLVATTLFEQRHLLEPRSSHEQA